MRLRRLVFTLLLSLLASACSGAGAGEPSVQPTSRDGGAATGATSGAAGADGVDRPLTSAERRVSRLVETWYAHADPRVCARMTDRLLVFGWERRGERGRRACRASLRKAEPVKDTRIEAVTVDGPAAQVEVSYLLDGNRRTDTILLVRRDGRWLLDEVAGVQDLPEA